MGDVQVCRICLNMDVKMQNLSAYPLESYFASFMIDSKPVYTSLPPYACYECAALVKKFYLFREKCLRSQGLLCGIIDGCGKLTEPAIKSIPRKNLFAVTNVTSISIEQDNTTNCDYIEKPAFVVEVIKKEDHDDIDVPDHVSPDNGSSDDDDDECAKKDKKKIQDLEKVEISVKIDNEEESDGAEILETAVDKPKLPIKKCQTAQPKKRVRPKRSHTADAKKSLAKVKKDDTEYEEKTDDMINVITLSLEDQLEEMNKRKQSSNYLDCPYKCHQCYRGFNNTHAWKHHLTKHSPNLGDIECKICKYRFKTKRNLQRHALNHGKRYVCNLCPYNSSNMQQKTEMQHGQEKSPNKNIDSDLTKKNENTFDPMTVFTVHSDSDTNNMDNESIFELTIEYQDQSDTTTNNLEFQDIDGRRIIDFKFFMNQLVLIDQHGEKFGCRLNSLKVIQETQKGLISKFDLVCCMCVSLFKLETCNEGNLNLNVNTGAVSGVIKVGIVFSNLNELTASMELTTVKQHQGSHKGVTHKCKYCDEVFNVRTTYVSHMRIKHPSENICGFCGYSFYSKQGLVVHKNMMHKDLEAKQEEKTEEGPYCEECDVKFISTEAYKRHMVMSVKHTRTTHSMNGCRVCGEIFTDPEELRLHNREEHPKKQPKHYNYQRKSQARTKWPAKCQHCPEEFATPRSYWNHYRLKHPDKYEPVRKNCVCDICGKRYACNAVLELHKRTHFGERPYKCSQCDKACFSAHDLRVHQQKHSDTRPFPCSVCSQAFKRKEALERHLKIHSGDNPYKCEICGVAFAKSCTRTLHVRTVHTKEPPPPRKRRNKVNK